jgi:hypothetical protein
MRECVKVILGVLALTIGASAPSLIFEAIRPGTLVPLNTPSPSGRDAQTERGAYSTEHHGDRQTAQQNPSNPPALLDNQQSQNQDAIATQPKHQTGSLGYKVIATMMDDRTQTWEPFTRAPSQLTVIAGEPEMKN